MHDNQSLKNTVLAGCTYWCGVIDEGQQWWDDALRDDIVPALRAITSDVSQCPHCLLAHVRVLRAEQSYQQWDSTVVHYSVCLLGVARGYVGECPGCLKLQQRTAVTDTRKSRLL